MCGSRNTFATFSEKMSSSFRGRRSTLNVSMHRHHRHFAWQAQHFRRVCVIFANRIVRTGSIDDKVQIPWQALHFVSCDEN